MGAGVPAQAAQDHAVEGGVGLPVASAVEPVPGGLPGRGGSNGAHHVHDYVGSLTTNGSSTDESLATGGTTCRLGDRSAYFWPVLRSRQDVAGGDVTGEDVTAHT